MTEELQLLISGSAPLWAGVYREGSTMADDLKAVTEENARRVARWLAENRVEFEGEGVGEDRLAPALRMASAEITEAVDHLEAREEVVRVPRTLAVPPQFLLKPGRGWPEVRDEILAGKAST